MPDESPRLPTPQRLELPPGAPPGALPLAYEPTPAERERLRWARMARFGRHRWAARGTGILGVSGAIVLSLASAIDPWSTGGTRGGGLAWLLALGVPVLAAVYRVLLAQWDQEAARYGGGRLSLDAWRAGDVQADVARDLARDVARDDR